MNDRSSVISAGLSVACIQTLAHDRADFAKRWPAILDSMREAGRAGAQLIVAPEATVPAYVLGTVPVEAAIIEAARRDVARVADEFGCVVVYGTAHHAPDGRQFNAAYVVVPGAGLTGIACKGFLWHFDRRWFAAAGATEPIDTPIGRLGVLICADGRIPTIAHTLARRGAEVLVMPTAWVTSGRDPQSLENLQADLMIRTRARENGLAVVAANKCGVEAHSVAYCGKSIIVDGAGAIVAQAPQHGATILHGRIELGRAAESAARTLPALASTTLEPLVRRIAIVPRRRQAALHDLALLAVQADVNALVADADAGAAIETLVVGNTPAPGSIAGVATITIGDAELHDPAALIEARLRGIDLFCVYAASDDEWTTRFSRTRAAELRAFVVTIGPERAFACDPDGNVVAGTFGAFEMASFVYDGARTRSGFVAPTTDVFEGMREQARRAQSGTTAR